MGETPRTDELATVCEYGATPAGRCDGCNVDMPAGVRVWHTTRARRLCWGCGLDRLGTVEERRAAGLLPKEAPR